MGMYLCVCVCVCECLNLCRVFADGACVYEHTCDVTAPPQHKAHNFETRNTLLTSRHHTVPHIAIFCTRIRTRTHTRMCTQTRTQAHARARKHAHAHALIRQLTHHPTRQLYQISFWLLVTSIADIHGKERDLYWRQVLEIDLYIGMCV